MAHSTFQNSPDLKNITLFLDENHTLCLFDNTGNPYPIHGLHFKSPSNSHMMCKVGNNTISVNEEIKRLKNTQNKKISYRPLDHIYIHTKNGYMKLKTYIRMIRPDIKIS